MGKIWRIHTAMSNPKYDLPDWVQNPSYRWYYPPDQDHDLPDHGGSNDSHTKFPTSQFPMKISPISSDVCRS